MANEEVHIKMASGFSQLTCTTVDRIILPIWLQRTDSKSDNFAFKASFICGSDTYRVDYYQIFINSNLAHQELNKLSKPLNIKLAISAQNHKVRFIIVHSYLLKNECRFTAMTGSIFWLISDIQK